MGAQFMLNIRLRELRHNKNLSQADVAEFLRISRQAYNFYETGKREPDNETLQKLASFFDVSTDYLLGRTDERNSGSISNDEDWPSDVKVMMRDASKLNDEQKEIVRRLIKEFVNEKK